MIKNEFEDELSNPDSSGAAAAADDRSRRNRLESVKNSDGPNFEDQNFGDHFLLEGFSVDQNRNGSRVGDDGDDGDVGDVGDVGDADAVSGEEDLEG